MGIVESRVGSVITEHREAINKQTTTKSIWDTANTIKEGNLKQLILKASRNLLQHAQDKFIEENHCEGA